METIKIAYRGWHLSPLFIVGKYTLWFTSGITFGKKHSCGHITYYLGWLLLSIKTKYHTDFTERMWAGIWPKAKIWIVKYSK